MSYTGKSLTKVLLWFVGLLMAAIAIWQFCLFVVFKDAQGVLDVQGGAFNLWLAIGATAIACACVFVGILRHINQPEEFHITS
jgi:uncharacterized membrane protein YbhN (UPF0104 family)